ncbi:DUF998 domain-containing protein [Microbacterium sp. KUDC0406]|uniref:DUF998 domain-containing protein n=1 Tax=Microbacterium sp. KUDC0406 TaxID=2909588 RepID=UPI001F47E931|nr:DUF998 domain-containing protein [Microbacterium sp. KUDC0406]UJP10717.1 DUF998 domain-containing protein [Microbacterium sp. KUDC0406]
MLCAAILLCIAIVVAALTTTDPGWWHLYFSRLGMMGDLSSTFFNGGLIVSGLVIAASAVPLRAALSAAAVVSARIATLLTLSVAGLGASLAGIGLFPLSDDPLAHERATNGVVLSFACLLIVHRVGLWRRSRTLRIATVVAAPAILIGMGLLIAEWITLTVFEMLAFGVILAWVHLFERAVGRRTLEMRNNGGVREDIGKSETEGASCSKPTSLTSPSARRREISPLPIWSTNSCAPRMTGMPGMTRAPSRITSPCSQVRIRSGSA